ncbi:hypothetical protein [Paenibacillus senegalimassiliensis]|uniref:hypothetical protein n=1 Tax=Paenibacillus senegalimassiliensis TaxID=1737426 RepID=UPI00073F00AB|nr:hypothetical protein [Paenibacillus senegalimassiliensis]
MNDIWLDAIVLSSICTIGAILMLLLERGARLLHKRRGTTPVSKYNDPDYFRLIVYIFLFLSVFFIGEAIFKSIT